MLRCCREECHTEMDRTEVRKLPLLAMQLNGAAHSGKYGHVTTDVVKKELASGDIFGFLAREVGADVDLKPLDDKMRLELAREWQTASTAYETKQYHIEHNGLALLVAYLLGGIYMRVVIPPR